MSDLVLPSIITLGSILLLNKLLIWYRTHRAIKKKKKDVDSRKVGLFQKFQGMQIPFENKDRICRLSGKEIHSELKSGKLITVDMLEAFQANAILENSKYNFLADIIYEADVASLMIDLDNDNGVMGLPLGVSDSLCVTKYDSTFGLSAETFNPATKDSVVIEVLREFGSVLAIITNVSQGDLSGNTSNPITGQTLNCWDVTRSCGGSSGGLGVALATGSCVIGVATDIRGDIRVPASFCGVFGLKPSSGRVARRHGKRVGPNQNIIMESIGPMARNIDDLVALFRSMVSTRMFELDPMCPPIPFNEDLFTSDTPLKIGYYVGLGCKHLHPVPAVERAVLMAKCALERAGHELVEYQLPNIQLIEDKIYTKIMSSDGGQAVVNALKNDPLDKSIRLYVRLLKLPRCVKRLLGSLSGLFCKSGSEWFAGLAGVSSVYKVWELQELVDGFKEEVVGSMKTNKLDGLICPVAPIVAPKVNGSNCILNENPYTFVYNILDYVAGAVPVTKVTQKDVEDLRKSYSLRSKCCQRIANAQKDSVGMPVGVQCVALPWREEVGLRIMKDLVGHVEESA